MSSYSIASASRPGCLAMTAEAPLSYVRGPTGFVEGGDTLLVEQGHEPERARTEHFGSTGS